MPPPPFVGQASLIGFESTTIQDLRARPQAQLHPASFGQYLLRGTRLAGGGDGLIPIFPASLALEEHIN